MVSNTIYFILRGYFPGTAPTIHCLNWFKEFDKLNIKAKIVNIRHDGLFSKMPDIYNNMTIVDLWSKDHIHKTRAIRFISHLLNAFLFARTIKKGDIVWIYDCPEILPFFLKSGAHVYNEVTEHPGVRGISKIPSIYNKLIERSYRNLDGLFVITNALKEVFVSKGVDSNKIHIINMTVEPERFRNLHKNDYSDKVVFCGNGANPKDGVDILIQSFKIFHDKYPTYKLYVIGPKPDCTEKDGNYELVRKLNATDFIIFEGLKTFEEVPQLLTDAKILALARPDSLQAQNGFPTKLGEYLLTGNPVVTTSVGEIPLFLKHLEHAVLAEPGDIIDFADKLCWVHDNYHKACNIGMKGQNLALANFNPKIELDKMIKVMNIKN